MLLQIIIIILFLYLLNRFLKRDIEHFTTKPIIWAYWETLPGQKKPGYIDLCLDSIKHNCSKCFEIIVCNNITILQYIPEIANYDLSKLKIQQKVDIYRYFLLHKYGGIWIDADTLVLKCFCKYYNLLNQYDYVGFGCGYTKGECRQLESGYGKPVNWIMISKPNTPYLQCIKNKCIQMINNPDLDYHDLGRVALSECYDKLNKENNWTYHHVPSRCQEYDSYGNKLNNIFKSFNIDDCKDERVFFPLYNTAPGYPDWFKELSKEDIIDNKDLPIHSLIKDAFDKKLNCQAK